MDTFKTKLIQAVILCFLLSLSFSTLHSQNTYELLYVQGKYEDILEQSKHFANAEDYYWNALVLDKKGETIRAISILNDGISLFAEAEIEKLLAEFLFKTGQYTRSKPYLYRYQAIPDFFIMLVKTLEFEGKYKEAVSILEERLNTDSLNLEYLSRLGDNYHEIDNPDAAIQMYKRIVHINPKDQASLIKLANLYLIKKAYPQSIAICDSLLKSDSVNSKAIRIRALASFRKSDFTSAAIDFTKLLAAGDSGLVVLKHLGISESKSYSFHDSRKHLSMAYMLDSMDHEICFFLARGYLNSRNPEKGIYYLNRADSLLRPNPEVLASLALEKVSIYSTLKLYDEALYNYLLAYKYSPRPEYLFYIGSLYQFRFDDKVKAIEYYSQFLESLPAQDDSDSFTLKDQQTITLKKVAGDNIEQLREELFFKGELEDE